jgi:type VI secretion system secreted protein Hcp
MRREFSLAFFLTAALAGPAFAGPIYMNYEGIKGEVTSAGHGGWIEIDSVQWAPPPPAVPPAPAPAGVATGGPGTLRFVKKADKASSLLSKAAATGRLVPAVQIDVQKGAAYQRYELKNVMISSYSVSGQGSGDPIPTESISFNFSKIEYKYPEQKAPPSGAPPLAGYSLSGAPKTPTPSKGTTTQAPARR